jgi:hypothetical protein
MAKRMTLIHGAKADTDGQVTVETKASPSSALRVAYVLSGLAIAAMVASSVLGLAVDGLYHDREWASEALRGGDLVTLVVAAPLLALSLVMTMRGSRRWPAVWIGVLGYGVYNYAFYVFGASFNDAFPLHILAMSLSLFAIAFGLPALDHDAIGESLRNDRWARWLGGILVAVGVLQAAAWIVLLIRYIVTGELLKQIPVTGQHLIFALDLTLMMPALVIAGVLLFRREAIGYLLGTSAATLGAVYSLNGNAAAWFQAHAGVAGAVSISPTNVIITISMFVPALGLWFGWRRRASGRAGAAAR